MWHLPLHPMQGAFLGVAKRRRFARLHRILGAIVATGLFSFPAFGADAVLSWTPPTQNTDGSALTNLSGYTIVYGTNANTLSQRITLTNPALTSYVVTNLTTGTWYFGVMALNSSGATSNLSNIATKSIVDAAPVPNAPIVSNTAREVFSVSKRLNGFVLLVVGEVPAGTACDATQSVNGFYVVPQSAVTWYGSTKPDVVVAKCN